MNVELHNLANFGANIFRCMLANSTVSTNCQCHGSKTTADSGIESVMNLMISLILDLDFQEILLKLVECCEKLRKTRNG